MIQILGWKGIKKMKIIKYEYYNEDEDIIEEIDIYGFCTYCKSHVGINEKYKRTKGKLYHFECFEQMRR